MAGAPEIIQLNMLLMKATGAKKVLDVGVFTGISALAAALSIPEDGKVIACDINEEPVNIGKLTNYLKRLETFLMYTLG